ncbi:hypothetical protein MBLNU230_g8323t1 [Neophaeotheca triangularis]
MAPKRKLSGTTAAMDMQQQQQPKGGSMGPPPPLKKRASSRLNGVNATTANPDVNTDIKDAPNATRASPDSDVNDEIVPGPVDGVNGIKEESPLSDAPDIVAEPVVKMNGKGRKAKAAEEVKAAEDKVGAVVDAAANGDGQAVKKGRGKRAQVKQEQAEDAPAAVEPAKKVAPPKKSTDQAADPEVEGEEEADEEEIQEALSRPPPVNSDYLPLPWKGRLGYACLNTYLRQSNPPVFSSRTCRIASILEHRHPLRDPSQPEHATKNRPDKTKPADVELGKRYVESICLANVYDINKMIRWNDRYNIKFLRLSSEMFPFASHPEYGYKLTPFASEALAEAGKTIAKYGHRVTTHPGQFTQLGSPRKQVIDNALRDLSYHDEMLSLLKLPEQLDKDAVMIMHMGGLFDGKEATLDRFRENYKDLPQSIKNRLVLENDDVIWTVHDLLPICEELNIPFVLDYHHHNIMFDSDKIREGTKDIMDLYPRIKATWDRKGITQKMHYSEPTPPAITGRQRRKHNPRPATLPPCTPDMDLMIEAKDKEQAVFELMKTFKLPGHDTFNDILPYTRRDDNKSILAAANKKKTPAPSSKKGKSKKSVKSEETDDTDASVATADTATEPALIPDDDVGMGGPEGRVYWPPGMEEWLRPKKREVKKKEPAAAGKSAAQIKKEATEAYQALEARKAAEANGGAKEEGVSSESDADATPATKKAKAAMRKKDRADKAKAVEKAAMADAKAAAKKEAGAGGGGGKGGTGAAKKGRAKKQQQVEEEEEEKAAPTPSASDEEEDAEMELDDDDEEEDDKPLTSAKRRANVGGAAAANGAGGRRSGGRAAKAKAVNYQDDGDEEMDEE